MLLLFTIANDFAKPPVTDKAKVAVLARDEVDANEALVANEAVPNKLPVIPPDTFNDPVI
jgi:hypothetical protein